MAEPRCPPNSPGEERETGRMEENSRGRASGESQKARAVLATKLTLK